MVRIPIGQISEHTGGLVTICGFVETIRDQKKRQFLVVRDFSGQIQAIHEKQSGEDPIATQISAMCEESTVCITGKVVANEVVKLGGMEITIESIEIVGPACQHMPINGQSSLDSRLDWRFLDLRRPENLLIFQIQTAMEHAMRCFWMERSFLEIHSPKLMETASESGAELFKMEYFGKIAYLAQSPQFYKQMAMASGFDRIFEIGPVFRANPSFTSRHDTEFTSIDVELSWIDSHEDVMQLEEEWLCYVLLSLQQEFGTRIKETYGVDVVIPEVPFPRVTMEEAYAILKEQGYAVTRAEKGDLDPEGERVLARYIKEKFGHEFVFVTNYPVSVRPFYHMRQPDNPGLTKSYDLLWRGLEITTGAQREHRYDVLLRQVEEKGLSVEPLQHYLDFFKFGCPPHGGYGAGLTRLLMTLLELKNVREVTYLYRGPNRLAP
ncbi:MAG: aspartate--tRNA(Asn) ligase [Candidatus Moranbacteria bacterium RIFOXYA12_FULL_44_15]|nr:MAG: aspartate--tRNA(Asn) ligase [Candidatus Moranbacteria bacterium RIFOXYA12_FULL_44_15]